MIDGQTPYEMPFPAGMKLPEIHIEKRHYEKLGIPSSTSNFDFLRKLCFEGVKKRGIINAPNKEEYYSRLKMELSIFKELGFIDYVLLNWDIINFCHEAGIPTGAGRGSAAGSLVLYVIGVTNIDPIKYDLFFERFVSKSRAKKIIYKGEEFLSGSLAPDVDNDISYDRRQEVLDYVNTKYAGKTSKILTLNTLSSKLCIKECGKIVSRMSETEVNAISDLIPKKFGKVAKLNNAFEESEAFKEFCNNNNQLYSIAKKLEGLNKNFGVHPSGIAISFYPIKEIIPIQTTGEDSLVSGYDMNSVAELMVKFDILGLRTLSVVNDVCKQLNIKVEDIDCNHPSIYAALQILECPKGLFQIEADTNFRVAQKVKPINLQELSDVIALARPATLQFVDEYLQQKNNPHPSNIHPRIDEILKSSKNVLLYQESMMHIAHQVFGLSLDEAETLRKIVGKKLTDQIDAWKDKIQKAGENLHLEQKVIDYFWSFVEAAANYGFNKCAFEEELVETRFGKKMLKEVQIGDWVRSFDIEKQENHYVEVLDIMQNEKEVFEFEMENGLSVRCSLDHKFLCSHDLKMRPIKEILEKNYEIVCN